MQIYSTLFDYAPIAYLVVDRCQVIREVNLHAAATFNAPQQALIGRPMIEFIHRDDQDSFGRQLRACRNRSQTTIFELKMKTAPGRLFDCKVRIQPVPYPCETQPHYSVTLVDLREYVQGASRFALEQSSLEVACSAGDKQELMAAYVRMIKSYLQCDAVGIRLRDAAGHIPYQAYDGFSREFFESECSLHMPAEPCMCTAVINGGVESKQSFFTDQGAFYLNSTSRYLAAVPPENRSGVRKTCHAHGYESVVLVPITTGTAIEGLIHAADRRENRFPLRVVETLQAVGVRLSLSLQRFHLQERLYESVDALNNLSGHLLTVQEDEQRRIAMELHDGCGQDLNVLKLRLKSIQNRLPAEAADVTKALGGLLALADKIIDDIRNIAHNLKPAALDALGLVAATRQMIREHSSLAGVRVKTDIDLLDQVNDSMVQVCLFRIFQEAFTNIYKHAQATRVLFTARREGDTLRIQVLDNGIGFENRSASKRADGQSAMGLSAMALRCRMIGATLSIDSQSGQGARLTIRLPLARPGTDP